MALALGVHIIFASLGISIPLIIIAAEIIGTKINDPHYIVFAKRLAVVFIILFAVGTASGTIVALTLALVWPKFMALAGQVAISTMYIEVFVFFIESIFLGIYAVSWNKFKGKYTHAIVGIPIVIGAAASAALITSLNAFMNTPVGFNIQNYLKIGSVTGVSPLAVFSSPTTFIEVSHVITTAYFTGTFIVIGFLTYKLMHEKDKLLKMYYKKMVRFVFFIAVIATILAVYTGINSIANLYHTQPEKYAAIEANFYPTTYAPEHLGGILVNGKFIDYINIPYLQSILATGTPNGSVPGLSDYSKSTWPPLIVHVMFDFLVGTGFAIGLFILFILLLEFLKKKPFENKIVLTLTVFVSIISIFMLEDGWVMAELARQPWIIYNVLLVSSAANYSTNIIPAGIAIIVFYIIIIPFTALVIKKIFEKRDLVKELLL